MTSYQMLLIFFAYAFLGWCTEVVFQAACHGKFINRGFLNGPVCPIYGFGVLLVVLCLTPLTEHPIFLFLASVMITSALEFVTGFILERFFHDKWWDYSNMPMNIKGYVCLHFSMIWGLACVLVMYVVHPMIMKGINLIPRVLGIVLLCVFGAAIVSDFVITLFATVKLRHNLRTMREISEKLRRISDDIGEPLARGAINARAKVDEHRDEIDDIKAKYTIKRDESKAELEALVEKYHAAIKKSGFTARRLLASYPHLSNGLHKDSFEAIKNYWKKLKDEKLSAKHTREK